MLRHLDKPRPTPGYRFVSHNHEFGVLQIRVQPIAEASASLPVRIKLMKRLLAAFQPHNGPLLPLFNDGDVGTLSCPAKADMLELSGIRFPILRIGKGKSPETVQWPAWQTISRITRIRGLSLEAIVHADPAMQRVKSFCPQRTVASPN